LIDRVSETYDNTNHETNTQVYTMSTHDAYHAGRKMQVGSQSIYIDKCLARAELELNKCLTRA